MKPKIKQEFYKNKKYLETVLDNAVKDYLMAGATINALGQYFFKNGSRELMESICGSTLMNEQFPDLVQECKRIITEELQSEIFEQEESNRVIFLSEAKEEYFKYSN
ncbi:hypothetical protein H8D57_02150 [bacterium]|nr:hypothetical protein [bacterium]